MYKSTCPGFQTLVSVSLCVCLNDEQVGSGNTHKRGKQACVLPVQKQSREFRSAATASLQVCDDRHQSDGDKSVAPQTPSRQLCRKCDKGQKEACMLLPTCTNIRARRFPSPKTSRHATASKLPRRKIIGWQSPASTLMSFPSETNCFISPCEAVKQRKRLHKNATSM